MSEKQIHNLIYPLIQIYSQIEIEMILELAEWFMKNNELGGTMEWYIDQLHDMGFFTQENIKLLNRYSGRTTTDINKMLRNAGRGTLEELNRTNPIRVYASQKHRSIIKSAVHEVEDIMQLINTNALESLKREYIQILTQAYIETSSGLYSYDESIKKAIFKLVDNGISGSTYLRQGKEVNFSLEATVRRDVITKTRQLGGELTLNNCHELDINTVLVSSHYGARVDTKDPINDHQSWQGKVYMIDGFDNKYGNLYTQTGYGQLLGLLGVNCRHNFKPFIEGATMIPDKKDIDKNEQIYKLEQYQRGLERKIRQDKKNQIVAKKFDDEIALERYKNLEKKHYEELRQFTSEYEELTLDYSRTQIYS